jgi:hypothetical protein
MPRRERIKLDERPRCAVCLLDIACDTYNITVPYLEHQGIEGL